MDISTLTAMALFALIASISPGPINILATASGCNFGYTLTLPHIIGATFGFVTILLLLGLGAIELLSINAQIVTFMSYFGVGFLLFMAYKISFAPLVKNNSKSTRPPSLLEGLLFQWCNPKAWLMAISAISTFAHNKIIDNLSIVIFSAIFFVVCFLSISTWAIAGRYLQNFLKHPKHHNYFRYSASCLLLITIFMLFL